MTDSEPGFECCFCGKTISKPLEDQAVVLSAVNIADWRNQSPEPRYQSFYAHASCLTENWSGRMNWEIGALVAVN
jgi:hypothetical protein